MLEVWKEFFRLKWEEISEWFDNSKNEIKWKFPIIAFVAYMLFVVVPIMIIKGENNVSSTYVSIPFLIMLFIYLIYVLGILLKWLRSNWKQAKKNVSKRCV